MEQTKRFISKCMLYILKEIYTIYPEAAPHTHNSWLQCCSQCTFRLQKYLYKLRYINVIHLFETFYFLLSSPQIIHTKNCTQLFLKFYLLYLECIESLAIWIGAFDDDELNWIWSVAIETNVRHLVVVNIPRTDLVGWKQRHSAFRPRNHPPFAEINNLLIDIKNMQGHVI